MNPSYLGRSRVRGVLQLVFASSLLVAVFGCSVSVAPPPPPPAPCGEDPSVACSQGVGWSCTPGDDPESQEDGLRCSAPIPDGPQDDFCCWEF